MSLFFNKVAGFIKKETLAKVFSCKFREFSKNIFSQRTPVVATSDANSVEYQTRSPTVRQYITTLDVVEY